MTLPDFINGAFEAAGGAFVFNHCRVLYADKTVRGVSIVSTAVFTAWGFWNLYYYPHLNQWASFAGGLVIVTGNFIWLAMMFYYGRRPVAPPSPDSLEALLVEGQKRFTSQMAEAHRLIDGGGV